MKLNILQSFKLIFYVLIVFILFNPQARNASFFRNNVCCIISFCDIDIEMMPKRPISIELPWFWNSLFCKNTSLRFYSRSQSDVFYSWWPVSLEKYRFCSSHQNPVCRKIIDSAIFFNFYRSLNTYFSTISLISCINVPIKTWHLWRMIRLISLPFWSFH